MFLMLYYIYGVSGPSLLIESTDYDNKEYLIIGMEASCHILSGTVNNVS